MAKPMSSDEFERLTKEMLELIKQIKSEPEKLDELLPQIETLMAALDELHKDTE